MIFYSSRRGKLITFEKICRNLSDPKFWRYILLSIHLNCVHGLTTLGGFYLWVEISWRHFLLSWEIIKICCWVTAGKANKVSRCPRKGVWNISRRRFWQCRKTCPLSQIFLGRYDNLYVCGEGVCMRVCVCMYALNSQEAFALNF